MTPRYGLGSYQYFATWTEEESVAADALDASSPSSTASISNGARGGASSFSVLVVAAMDAAVTSAVYSAVSVKALR
jgi:hypothetical protein